MEATCIVIRTSVNKRTGHIYTSFICDGLRQTEDIQKATRFTKEQAHQEAKEYNHASSRDTTNAFFFDVRYQVLDLSSNVDCRRAR